MFVKAVTLNDGRMSDTYNGCEAGALYDFVVQGPWEEEVVRRIWAAVIADLGLRGGTLLFSQKVPDIGRATYIGASHVYKVAIHALDASRYARANDMAAEYAILKKCAGIAGIPLAGDLKRTPEYDALMIEKVDGAPANDLGIAPLKKAVISIKLIPLMVKLAARHVSHNDITFENVLVKPRNPPVLIDFDQATDASFVAAVRAMFFGRAVVGQVVTDVFSTYSRNPLLIFAKPVCDFFLFLCNEKSECFGRSAVSGCPACLRIARRLRCARLGRLLRRQTRVRLACE